MSEATKKNWVENKELTIVVCKCGCGVIVRPAAGGILKGKCPVCSNDCQYKPEKLEGRET